LHTPSLVFLEHFKKHVTVSFNCRCGQLWWENSLQDDRTVNDDRPSSQHACTAGHSSSAFRLCQPLYESVRVLLCEHTRHTLDAARLDAAPLDVASPRHLSKQVWYQYSLDNHCELGLAVTQYGMLQSKSMPCNDHATVTGMTVPCLCVHLYNEACFMASSIRFLLPLKPSVSKFCPVHLLLSSFANMVTHGSIAE
jgi:hypothetical protein